MNQDIEIKAAPRQTIEVIDPIPLLSTGHFEQMQRLATLLAESTLIPDSLRMTPQLNEDGWPVTRNGKNIMVELPHRSIVSNCFLVVEQAVRWGLSPFGVAQCVSVVHGRLCYEGKLVAGVLDAKLGIELDYKWNDLAGDAFGIEVSARTPKRGEVKSIKGTVGEWKTAGNNSPWAKPSNHHRMLAYRGAREWARIFKSSLMLGVYTPDELESLEARPRINPVQNALGEPRQAWSAPRVMELPQAESQPAVKSEASASVSDSGVPRIELPGAEGAEPVDENPTITEPTQSNGGSLTTSNTQDGPQRVGEETTSPEPAKTSTTNDGSMTMNSENPGGGQAETTAAASTVPPEPTDAANYEAYCVSWVGKCEDRRDASAEWTAQRRLRNKLQVPMEIVERCKVLIEAAFPREAASE